MKQFNLMLGVFVVAISMVACDQASDSSDANSKAKPAKSIDDVLAAQDDEIKARYDARHPKETLAFFGVQPGMVVVEVLPGGGWYTKILVPFLGTSGQLIGADYSAEMYPKFGMLDEKALEAKRSWVGTWTKEVEVWRDRDSASVGAFQLGRMPSANEGSADVILFIRALHNLARFENDGAYLTQGLSDAYRVLKPGGIVGVVQHIAPDDASDEWANGSHGYLKKSFVIERMERAGFEFVASSDINLNPADQPGERDIVWRLPPFLSTSKEDPKLAEKYKAIGESSRMTLAFRKPE